MLEPVTVRIRLGREYLYLPDLAGTQGAPAHAGERYVPVALAREVRSMQEVVVYHGEDGSDRDKWYTAPLDDWNRRFRLAGSEAEAAPPAVPVADPRQEAERQRASLRALGWRQELWGLHVGDHEDWLQPGSGRRFSLAGALREAGEAGWAGV